MNLFLWNYEAHSLIIQYVAAFSDPFINPDNEAPGV